MDKIVKIKERLNHLFFINKNDLNYSYVYKIIIKI